MEHIIDVIREKGLKVTVTYRNRGEVAWTRTRPYEGPDEQAVHGNSHGMPFYGVVGTLARRRK